MSFAELLSPGQLVSYLEQHDRAAYAVLFLGAFFETLIPFSLAVVGEVFFLSGALLAGMGALDVSGVMAVLYAGGILGDNASYWTGRHYGPALFERLASWPLFGKVVRPDSYAKGLAFFRRRGALAVFVARLSGPLSWVMPAMAGAFRLDYGKFLRFNALGVFIGISQFIIVGYFFGSHLEGILAWIDQAGIVIGTIVGIFLMLVAWRLLRSRAAARIDS
jgi:membrane-associated protein